MQNLRALITEVPNFPKPGILFRDITPLLANPVAFREVIDTWAGRYGDGGVTAVVGIESRGFIFAAALAQRLGVGFVPVRKPGKLPRPTFSASYALEYGTDTLQLHRDAFGPQDRVVIVDDLLATGGTARAATQLVAQSGAQVVEVAVLIELKALHGRRALADVPVHSVLEY